ncbi:dioxygenase family protein [Microbacterium luticocti]|uniref:dioxygenase family protein n=1 Tax=Microbacterium luticocti TaxID=451764 RepID=UPI00041E45B9|nr:class III extradiol ring-cleavage dioxygenase [Microbacterium luticocti]
MAFVLNPTRPAGAFDDFFVAGAAASAAQRRWTSADGPMPALFLSHGAPPVFDDPEWIRMLADWALSLPKPTAVLIVSAHWEDAPLAISSPDAGTPLVYDFGGFHPRYYEMRYDTPDATALAREVTGLFSDVGAHEQRRGLDHGAWVPLKVMYPLADVPVLQLSMPTEHPDALFAIGRRLRALREQGVLVIGSGHMTHGIPFVTREMLHGDVVPTWSIDFDAWATEALDRGAIDELLDYRHRAPGMPYAHPTADHFVPMFITLGAGDPEANRPVTRVDGYMAGFSRRSFQLS